jgi:hypothetical protein
MRVTLGLRIEGARQNNLKNISLEIPHDRLTVITGVSGSGKSSLAFDTVFAEGHWRYMESLSTYARMFLERLDRPDVDRIERIRSAVALEQKNPTRTARSTVGTATEIADYLRVLYAKVGRLHCPRCGAPAAAHSAQSIVDNGRRQHKGPFSEVPVLGTRPWVAVGLPPKYSADNGAVKRILGRKEPLDRGAGPLKAPSKRASASEIPGWRACVNRSGVAAVQGGDEWWRAIQPLSRQPEGGKDRANGVRILNGRDQAQARAAARAREHVDVERAPHEISPRPMSGVPRWCCVSRRGGRARRSAGRGRGHCERQSEGETGSKCVAFGAPDVIVDGGLRRNARLGWKDSWKTPRDGRCPRGAA